MERKAARTRQIRHERPTLPERWALAAAVARGVKKMRFYNEAIVTFIDILGFKEIVADQPPSSLFRAVQNFYYAGDAGTQAHDDVGLNVVAFSDSIVRVRYTTLPSALFHEILALVHMQGELAVRGILIRGAMTFGNILVEGSTVFGPAMVQAYELESKIATHPRVILDPKLLAHFDAQRFQPTDNGHNLGVAPRRVA